MNILRALIVDEIAQVLVVSSRGKQRQRAIKRKIKKWPIKKKGVDNNVKIDIIQAISIIK